MQRQGRVGGWVREGGGDLGYAGDLKPQVGTIINIILLGILSGANACPPVTRNASLSFCYCLMLV